MHAPIKKKHILFTIAAFLGVLTFVCFTAGMSAMLEAEKEVAQHPLDIAFANFFFGTYTPMMLLPVVLLVGTVAYALYCGNKSRSGMVLAFGLSVVSLPAVVVGLIWGISVMTTGTYSFMHTELINETQIMVVLPISAFLSAVYLPAWFLLKPLVRKLIQRKRSRLDTPEKKRRYIKYLQAWGLVFMLLTLTVLPLSIEMIKQTKTPFEFSKLSQQWNIGIWIHSVSVFIAGMELVAGIRLLLDRSKGKTSVGALLLSSSFVTYFILGLGFILLMGKVRNWGIGSYDFYTDSMLFVITHRIVSAVLLGITILHCRSDCPRQTIDLNQLR